MGEVLMGDGGSFFQKKCRSLLQEMIGSLKAVIPGDFDLSLYGVPPYA